MWELNIYHSRLKKQMQYSLYFGCTSQNNIRRVLFAQKSDIQKVTQIL